MALKYFLEIKVNTSVNKNEHMNARHRKASILSFRFSFFKNSEINGSTFARTYPDIKTEIDFASEENSSFSLLYGEATVPMIQPSEVPKIMKVKLKTH